MRIKRLEIKNYIGISEFAMDLGKINWLSGHTGCGKTTIVESLEKGFTNKSRRTEVIRHGEDESRIFIQSDDGLEIERKIRTDKGDYLRVRKQGQNVPSTQGFLNKLISGEVFRPLEFVKKSPDEQAKIILNMLEIPWSTNDIQIWFGELPGVNYEAHILQVLKQIENLYYTQRESINREVSVLKAQVSGIRDGLPPNYDGAYWKEQKVQEFYSMVAQAEEVNKKILAAQNAIQGVQDKIDAINANAELDKQTKKNGYDRQRADGREFIQFLNQKIEKVQNVIDGMKHRVESETRDADKELALGIEKERSEYRKKLQELNDRHNEEIAALNHIAETAKESIKRTMAEEKTNAHEEIAKCKNSQTAKEQELLNIDSMEVQALLSIDEKTVEQIKTINAEAGNSQKVTDETKPIDIQPLQVAADNVAHMQSFLREFENMSDIITTKIAPKLELSQTLTARIETARKTPMELLKIAAVPIPEIAVDGDGKIRIAGTLLDGLSEGEQLELAFRVAKAQASQLGDLKVLCVDGIGKVNQANRLWLDEYMKTDDFQYFILDTTDTDLEVKIEGEI